MSDTQQPNTEQQGERRAPRPARPSSPPANMPVTESGGLSADNPDAPDAPSQRPGFVRKPFGNMAQKLNAPQRKGYHRHWFNDVLDRIEQAKAAGYAHVIEEGSRKPMKRVVGTAKGGGALTAYLMEIPIEWFEEDMRNGQKAVDEIDEAIRGGDVARKPDDERYTPNRGIKIEAD